MFGRMEKNAYMYAIYSIDSTEWNYIECNYTMDNELHRWRTMIDQ